MKKLGKLLLTCLLMASMQAFAQSTKAIEQVGDYLEVNGTMKQYSDAYNELMNLMERQYPKSDRNGNGWLYLERNKKRALSEIKNMLIPIYMKNFTEEEIGSLADFYNTETGKQLVVDRKGLTESQKKDVDTFFASGIGAKLSEKHATLSNEIAQVSEYWSSELYQTAVLLLGE